MVELLRKWRLILLCAGLLVAAGCGQAEIEVLGTSTPNNGNPSPSVSDTTIEPPPTPVITPSPDQSQPGSPTAAVVETPTTAASPTSAATATQADAKAEVPASPTTCPPATCAPATQAPQPPSSPAPTSPPPPSPTAGTDATVDYFQANVTEADPGDAITLEWATSNAVQVTLWRLMDTGQFAEWWDVAEVGSFDYQIPEHARNRITFALAVTAGVDDDSSTQMTTLAIPLRCPDTWFFAAHPDICPARAAVISAGAEQHFQGGVMLWSAGEDRIYVLYGDGQSPNWNAFPDQWDPGEPESDPTLEPPPGFYQPVRGFGQVWREQPGVRDRLGWALADEAAYQTAVQRTSYAKYNETFIQALDGRIWRLKAERSGWEKQ